MVQITALVDNRASGRRDLVSEHGLSLYVEYQGHRLLFDCGCTCAAVENACRMGTDLRGLEGVILSHSHYDHAAGFRELLQRGLGSKTVYTGPRFFEPKYSSEGLSYRNVSCGFGRDFLEEHGVTHREIEKTEQILPGVWLVSGFPRENPMETIPQRFVRRTRSGFVQDDFCDEVCMVLQLRDGLAVLVGCAHPGILNMVTHIRRELKQPVKAVFGGTHLAEAELSRTEATVRQLKELGVTLMGLSHCSGDGVDPFIARDPKLQGCHLATGESVFLE